jgi:endonuclease/exonuclease/phosphatase family metal-dependent hydrolase
VAEIVVASFNVHAGVDGWGRPFDVVEACRRIDADVLVLQEAWTPTDGGAGTVDEVASALGYQALSRPLARCMLLRPAEDGRPTSGWGPVLGGRHRAYGLRLIGGDPTATGLPPGSTPGGPRDAHDPEAGDLEAGDPTAPLGTWDLAVLSRVPLERDEIVDLGRLPRDQARRAAIVAHVDSDVLGHPLRVVGTHMSHLSAGSPRQFRRLVAALGAAGHVSDDTVVMGDMNLWGPPVSLLLPGLERVVRGRSWPAWRPLAQIDHVLAGPVLAADASGEVLDVDGSDHRPIRARFRSRAS